MKSCLICDDHAMVLEALAGVIDVAWPDASILTAKTFPEAWGAISAGPDLCISDLVMPGAPPREGIRRLRETSGKTPILVVTGNEEDSLLLDLYAMGIVGLVPKTSRATVIEAAIRVVLAGGKYMPERVLDLAVASGLPDTLSQSVRPGPTRLTDRQKQVLHLAAKGESSKEIARKLALSPSTVKAHTAAAIAVLGAANRTEAVAKALALGAISNSGT